MKKELVYSTSLILAATVCAITSESITADSVNYSLFGQVGFVAGNEITPPVSPGPEEPGKPVSPVWPGGVTPPPGTPGPLSIDYASSFDFGINNISTQDKIYYAKSQKYADSTLETPNYIQITDNRGTTAGWTLKVREVAQFHQENAAAKHPVLEGAMLSLVHPKAVSLNEGTPPTAQEVLDLVPEKETVVATAVKGAGAGTWIIRWGNELVAQDTLNQAEQSVKENFSKDVQLFVPGKTVKDAASYTTQLNWILSELPQNG
ncbi:WxL domain-containing protein [Lactococcus garvieae]|nr:WxL domain-containing protein [Lactococcus garvieae]